MSKSKKIKNPNTGGTKLPGAGHGGIHRDARRPSRNNVKATFRKEHA